MCHIHMYMYVYCKITYDVIRHHCEWHNASQLNVEILPKDSEKENHAFSSHQFVFKQDFSNIKKLLKFRYILKK